MKESKNAIEIRNLVKNFGSLRAVDHISLEIPEGCIFSLLGVNGAGKTTVIRILMGLTGADEGTLRILGRDPEKDHQVRRLINFSPQETAVAPNLTVRENLEFMARMYGADSKRAAKQRVEMIERLELGEVADRRAGQLSGGWQRRLSIGMALITGPRVLFLDEPTLGLDVLARRELWQVIERLRGRTTVVLTTHYMEEAQQLSDLVAVMVRGQIRCVGSPGELMERTHTANLEEAFLALAAGAGGTKTEKEERIV